MFVFGFFSYIVSVKTYREGGQMYSTVAICKGNQTSVNLDEILISDANHGFIPRNFVSDPLNNTINAKIRHTEKAPWLKYWFSHKENTDHQHLGVGAWIYLVFPEVPSSAWNTTCVLLATSVAQHKCITKQNRWH